MATQEKTWNVANRLHSLKDSDNPEVNHIIAGADEIYDDTKGAKQSDINAQTDVALANRYTKSETYSNEQLDALITTPDVNYVTVATFADLPQTGEANTIYRVSSYDGTQVDASKYALYAWNGATYQLLAVRSAVGEVFDVSEYNSGATYETLAAALAAVPTSVQRGGMSIKFILRTNTGTEEEPVYHDEYVLYRLMNTDWSTVITDWQGVDKVPTPGSHNFVESGGVQNELALGAIYDVSAKNPTAGPNNDGKFESLSALLSDANLNTLIPTAVRKGGMSIKFVQSSDNKYVQYRYMGTETTGSPNPFLDIANWQGVDDKPVGGSPNLVKSGGVLVDTMNKALKHLFDKSDFEVHTCDSARQQIDISTYNRIRMIYPVVPGMYIEALCSEGSGVDVTVQPLDLDTAIRAHEDTLLQTITSYTLNKVYSRIEVTGLLVISLKKTNGGYFTESEKESYIAATTIVLRKEIFTKDSSCVAFYPEIQETGKYINSSGIITSAAGCKYSKPFNLEAGDVVIFNNTFSSAFDIAVLSKYDNGKYIPLYIINARGWNPQEMYYFISDGGQYVLCYEGAFQCSIAKHIPLRLAYDALFTKLRTTDNLVLTKDDFQIHNIVTYGRYYRLRLFCPIPKDSRVVAACSLGKGLAVSIYNNETQVDAAKVDYLQTISYSYTSNVDAIANYDGYLLITLCKNDESEFTPQDIEDYLAATTITVTHNIHLVENDVIKQEILNLQEANKHELFLGQLINKSITATGFTDSNADKRVSTATCMVVPKEEGTISFTLPLNIYVGIRSGDQSTNLSNNDYWIGNGDTYTFRENVHYYRLCFANIVNGTQEAISVATVMDYIQNGLIKIFVENWENNIIKQNLESEKYVKAVMRNFVSGEGNNSSLHKLPIFAHTSDVHGDANRFNNFADYCDYIGVDAALVSGDTVATNSVDSMQYINDITDSHNTKILICMGNHDARNLMTAEAQHNTILKHNIEKYSLVTNPNEEFPTYYYHDFAGKQIRLISINLYELNHSVDTANFTQEQCEWFINTLANTPQDYGVLVMFHSPEKMPVKDDNHGVFYQNLINYNRLQVGITGNPFSQIIDAFIGRTTATISYTSNNSTSNTISISADFTNVASGVEFIAFVNGHLHVDRVGYIPSVTHKQLNLNVCCGVAIYGSTYHGLTNLSDMPRGCDGVTQDCFNIYAIDRAAKVVRIAKVGSNVSGDLVRRDYMAIPYAD